MNNSQPEGFPHNERVELPTNGHPTVAELYWLHSHSPQAGAPRGVRFLQLRKRLAGKGGEGLFAMEREAYNQALPSLQSAFRKGLASIKWEVVIQAPSSAPYASHFVQVAVESGATSPLVLEYDSLRLNGQTAGTGANADTLTAAIVAKQEIPSLESKVSVLIVDDVYAGGRTLTAVIQWLREHGLRPDAKIFIAVALRILSSTASAS